MNYLNVLSRRPLFISFFRRLLYWRYLAVYAWRRYRSQETKVAGHKITVLPGVFHPRAFRLGALFAECLNSEIIPRGASVLEMGTGCGSGAIALAGRANHVVATDVNPQAVRCAHLNVQRNGLRDKVTVLQSDLFESLTPRRFDVIAFNPPFLPGAPAGIEDMAFRSPGIIERFARQASHWLSPDGRILLGLSTDAPVDQILTIFKLEGFKTKLIRQREILCETFFLFEFRGQC